jgi:flagellin-like protein
MNRINFRNRKKGITPVIATIILIAGTLVLALVVGAYTFGLFGSNVKTITLTSGNLAAGVTGSSTVAATAYLTMSLNNPGADTYVSSLTLTSSSLTSSIVSWCAPTSSGGAPAAGCTAIVFTADTVGANDVGAGKVTPMTFYPQSSSSVPITSGQTFNYVINFANGQSVSGSLLAE